MHRFTAVRLAGWRAAQGLFILLRLPLTCFTLLVLSLVLFFVFPFLGLYGWSGRIAAGVFGLLAYYLLLWLSAGDEARSAPRNFDRRFWLYHVPIPLFALSHYAVVRSGDNLQYLVTLWPFAFTAVWIACVGGFIAALNPAILHRYLLIAILGWGLYLRLLGLLTEGLWYDELFTLWRSRPHLQFSQIIQLSANDFHPPLHYIGMWIWFKMVGVTPFTARIVGVVGGLLGILAMYGLGKRAGGRWAGVYAAFLTCVTYTHVYYSQEVRSYIFLFAATAWCYGAFLRLVDRPSPRSATILALAAGVTVYLHYYGFLVLLTQGVFLLLHPGRLKRDRAALLRWYAASMAAVLLAYLPWAGVAMNRMSVTKYWIRPPEPQFYVDYFQWYFREPLLVGLYLALIIGYLAYVFVFDRTSDSDRVQATPAILCLLAVLVGWFLPYLHSINATPMIFDRYTIICVPPLLLLVSLALAQIQTFQARIVLLGLIFVSATLNLFVHENYYERVDRMQVRELAADLLEDKTAIIAGDSLMTREFNYYFETLGPHPLPVVHTDEEFKVAIAEFPDDKPLRVWLFHALEDVPTNELILDVLKHFFYPVRQTEHYLASAVHYEYNDRIPRVMLREYLAGGSGEKADILQRIRALNSNIDWSQIGGQRPRSQAGGDTKEATPKRPEPVRRPTQATP
jgi:hypothetical protein